MTINILGTEYDFVESNEKDDPKLCGIAGYCDVTAKKLVVDGDYNKKHPLSTENPEYSVNLTKRHEVVHAFFFECGLTEWYGNEFLVDWVACQAPKMLEAFKAVDAL